MSTDGTDDGDGDGTGDADVDAGWAALFDRAAAVEATEDDVRAALSAVRGEPVGDGGDGTRDDSEGDDA